MINLVHIIDSLLASAVAIVGGSLWFADRLLKREANEHAKDPRAMRASIEKKELIDYGQSESFKAQ